MQAPDPDSLLGSSLSGVGVVLEAGEREVFDTAGCCEVFGDGCALLTPYVVEVVGDTGTERARSLPHVLPIAAVAVDQVDHSSRRARETVQDGERNSPIRNRGSTKAKSTDFTRAWEEARLP